MNETIGFPTWRYHRTKEAVIVNSPEELKSLGEGWEDTPAKFELPQLPDPVPVEPMHPPEKPKTKGKKS